MDVDLSNPCLKNRQLPLICQFLVAQWQREIPNFNEKIIALNGGFSIAMLIPRRYTLW